MSLMPGREAAAAAVAAADSGQKTIFDVAPVCARVHRMLLVLWFPLCIMCIVLSALFATIASNADSDVYDTNDWQYCLLKADEVTVNLELNISTPLGFTQKDGALGPLSMASLTGAMSYQGIQTTMFSAFGHMIMFRAWSHYEWLPSSIASMLFCGASILAFFPAGPIMPAPQGLSSSLVAIVKYLQREDVFDFSRCNPKDDDGDDDAAGADDPVDDDAYNCVNDDDPPRNCGHARNVLILYTVFQFIILFTIVALVFLGAYAEMARRRTPRRLYYKKLDAVVGPNICAVLLCIVYFMVNIVKADSSVLALEVYNNKETQQNMDTTHAYYPFSPGVFDVNIVLIVVTIMSIFRGYTKQSVSAYRLAAAAALLQGLLAYPLLISTYAYFHNWNLWSNNKCREFFEDYPVNDAGAGMQTTTPLGEAAVTVPFNIYGYPTSGQANNYCANARITLVGETFISGFNHLVAFVCAYTYAVNKDRPSEIFDNIQEASSGNMQTHQTMLPNYSGGSKVHENPVHDSLSSSVVAP